MLPWGTDQTWVQRIPFDHPGGLMFLWCVRDVSCAALYRDALASVRASLAGVDLDGLAASTAARLLPWQALDPRREYSLDQIDAAVSATREFIAVRPSDVDAYLAPEVAAGSAIGPQTRVGSSVETTITERPKGVTRSRRVKFRFRSSEPGSSFECRLDKKRFAPCDSPRRFRVGLGRHSFQVRAANAAGDVDATAASDRFEVVAAD
jgi:hypothetical protein